MTASPDFRPDRGLVRNVTTHEDALIAFLEAPEGKDVSTDDEGMSYVQLDAPLQDAVIAQLLDLCIQGASVMASSKEIGHLEPGSIVGLRIEHRRDGWALRTDAIVRSIRGIGRVRLGLEFEGGLAEDLVEAAGQYFNRRRTQRVDLTGGRVECRLNVDGVTLPARAHDLSVHGVAVRVPRRWCEPMRDQERGVLSLSLPDGGGVFERPILVVRRTFLEDEDEALLGLLFQATGGSSDQESQRRLEVFVRDYLRRRLRWAS